MDLRVIAFPCLMYLGPVVTGIILILRSTEAVGAEWQVLAYLSISVSLNVLTLVIIIRLVLHTRSTRATLGITGVGGLSKAIITMLVESCALYSASTLLVLAPINADNNPIANFFIPVFPETQDIATLLIILRTANKSALTSNTLVSGHLSTFKAGSGGGTTGTGDVLPASGEDPAGSVDRPGVDSGVVGVVIETMIK